MKMISKKNLDEWLFDYFEGNLSHSEQTALHHFLEINPECMEEFELWKETFVSEPLPNNVPVEKLIKQETGYKKLFSYMGLPALLISLLFTIGNPNSAEDKHEQNVKEQTVQKVLIEDIIQEYSEPQHLTIKSKKTALLFEQPVFHHELNKVKIPESTITITEKKDTHSETAIDSITPFTIQPKEKTKADKEIDVKEAKASNRKLKRSERRTRRTIRKMKQKAQERKEQEQFLKGKKPYVVPLDLQNF